MQVEMAKARGISRLEPWRRPNAASPDMQRVATKSFVLFEAAIKSPRWPTVFAVKPFRIMEAATTAKKNCIIIVRSAAH